MKTCDCCGKKYETILDEDAYLWDNCFDCSFWLKKTILPKENEARRVVVKGKHYMIATETGGGFKGFGGRPFRIRFFDGRGIDTNNLWYQGDIPPEFRVLLPDNAKFAQAEVAVSLVGDSEIPF